MVLFLYYNLISLKTKRLFVILNAANNSKRYNVHSDRGQQQQYIIIPGDTVNRLLLINVPTKTIIIICHTELNNNNNNNDIVIIMIIRVKR